MHQEQQNIFFEKSLVEFFAMMHFLRASG